jgi:hypothetical protein
MDTASPIALLLRGGIPSPDDHRLAEILDFFGIPWAALTISDARGDGVARLTAGHSMFSILTSAACLAEIMHVRRQSFWDTERFKLRESLARLVNDVMPLADGAASGDWQLSGV